MKQPTLGVIVAALLLLVARPGAGGSPSGLRVVATLPDLFVITKALVGNAAGVDVVARFGQNPHDMEVRPSHMLLLRRADVLVRNGLEEDAWIDVIALGSNNPKMVRGTPTVIEASIGIAVLKTPSGRVDRSFGDVHPLGSPHFTLDPGNMPIVTANIARGLARVAPEHAAMFESNRGVFLARVEMAATRWKQMLAPFQGAGIVSYHDSWPYFYRAFGLVEAGITSKIDLASRPRRIMLQRSSAGCPPRASRSSCMRAGTRGNSPISSLIERARRCSWYRRPQGPC